MNDETDKPLNTVGDDALEARITAWVLGEASSFEAGELEKLCAADPALGLFERRLRVLHGLVAEDYKTEPAVQWKLSAERRTKITDLLGVEPEVVEVLPRRKSHRGTSVRGLILALAACVVIGVASYSLLGGVGMKADMAMVKESARVVNYSAPAADIRAEVDSLRLEREGGAPVSKPDTSYAHLGTSSPFTSKPPAASAEVAQRRGAVARQEAVADDQRKLLSAVEAKQQSHYRHTADAGIADETTVDAKAELDMASNSLALLKEDAAGLPEQQIASRRKAQGIAGPAPAPATPAPAAKPAALAANGLVLTDPDSDGSKGRGFVGGGLVGGGGGGGAPGGRQTEAALETAGRTNADFIGTVDGVMIPGIPAAPGQKVEDIVTAGNRSGDGAITRNNIDAILNNPDRLAKDGAKGDGIAAVTGVWADNGLAPLEQAVEEKQEGFKIWLDSDVASGPEVEFQTRNPNPGEPANGAFGRGGVDSLADAEGRPPEPATQSRFSMSFRGGTERAADQGEATAFGNLEEMGRLSRGRQEEPGLRLGGELYYDNSTGGVPQGIADMTDLAEKQNEAVPSGGVVAGRWFGTATDESAKGLKDANAPGGAPADPFFDAPLPPGTQLGGLNRDLNDEFAPALEEAEGEVLAKKLEQGDRTRERVLPPVDGPVADPASGSTSLVQKEMIRRQNAVATSDELRNQARAAYAEGNYSDAVAKYKESLQTLPDAPLVVERRKFLEDSLGDAAVALSEEYRKVGKYEEARQLAAETLAKDASNAAAKRAMDYLDDPIRTNPALTYEHAQNVDEVRRKLYTAEGSYNLGKYDDAHRAYEEVLRLDPYNKAARRGMEQVATARADYYRAAYDQTRAQLLADVDKAWELSVPEQNEAAASPEPSKPKVAEQSVIRGEVPISPPTDGASAQPQTGLEDESKSLAEREVLRRNRPVLEFAQLRDEGREAYTKGDFQSAYDKYAAALGKLPDHPGMKGQRDFLTQSLGDAAAALASEIKRIGKDDESLEWAGKALEWDPSNETARRLLATEPTAEISTAAEPFSTFSLHVSDASFKLAQAAMERGEVPAAEGIRPEEFYNAFDYGDPAPASGEPVVCVTEQSAHPAFAQRNLLRIGVRTGSQGRGASTPLNLTLLLDHSGSMEREDRNAGLAMAVRQLSGLLKEGDTITVAGFSRQPRLLADRLPGARAQELNELIARTPSEGGTNLEEGLKLGEELAKRQFNPAAQNRVVLFTDGAANLGDARPEALQARIEGLRQQGIAFDAAGFGADGLNDKLLERLTRNGNGRYYVVDGPEDADAGFAKQLAGAFRPAAENVKVQVRFNPARVAKYKLIGFEEHRLKKEDFRNDAVDAAEMAAEEAGNALYQIETLPQGEGEVGEVSVRFRDVASGQMVERTWTIPYDAQAPAFDQAAPSIQLAGLAAFTAEKLRAAPMADAVDFQQLGQVYAGVRARYPNSQPVADLGSMIGKMK